MNLGIYIHDFNDASVLEDINELVNTKNNVVQDISIFFDDIGFNPFKIKCGMFNSTDLWSFNGTLIVLSNECAHTAINIVNNIDIYYHYRNHKETNFLGLMQLSKKIKFITHCEETSKYIFRSTGQKSLSICNNLQDTVSFLLEKRDGHKSNLNNVYKT